MQIVALTHFLHIIGVLCLQQRSSALGHCILCLFLGQHANLFILLIKFLQGQQHSMRNPSG